LSGEDPWGLKGKDKRQLKYDHEVILLGRKKKTGTSHTSRSNPVLGIKWKNKISVSVSLKEGAVKPSLHKSTHEYISCDNQ